MAKVTSKLQLTIPKAIAERYKIHPGDDLEWIAAGDAIRVIPSSSNLKSVHPRSVEERLSLFDQATLRQRAREATPPPQEAPVEEGWKPHEIERGWRREDLYSRGRPR
jgi:AbrB family looped-hinge helix DNA binding protein